MLYRPSSFRKTAIALTTGAVLAAAAAFPAAAQQALNDSQCRDARAVALATMKKFHISPSLAEGFVSFSKSCDLGTKFDMVPGTSDEKAFGEFRLKMTVIKMSNAKPGELAQR